MMDYVRYGCGGWGAMMKGGWEPVAPVLPYLYLVLHVITWFLVVAILMAILRWLWKKGGGK